jgi:hypothetical protein
MYVNNDHFTKFLTIEIQFADLNAKNDFKRLTNTDPVHNPILDFERIFPIPSNASLAERTFWRYEIWGSEAMDSEGETMKESGATLEFQLTTKIGIPTEFVKNLYLHSRIKKIRIQCSDTGDITYANESMTGSCKKRGCHHEWCEMVLQEWEAKYNWSKLPHPVLEVDRMLSWIKNNFHPAEDREAGLIYHQILSEVIKFRKLANSGLVAAAKDEFERQITLSGNAYLQTMLMLNDCEKSPDHVFKNGLSLIYKDAVDYYLKKTQLIRQIPKFPVKK